MPSRAMESGGTLASVCAIDVARRCGTTLLVECTALLGQATGGAPLHADIPRVPSCEARRNHAPSMLCNSPGMLAPHKPANGNGARVEMVAEV